jgi:very-short-patch-repair endonuclease
MAAVLAGGAGACLSHRSAAELWRLLEPRDRAVDLSIRTTSGRSRRPGIRLHRRASLSASAVTERVRIPVTRPAQTIADLRRAIRQAEVLGLRTGLEEGSEPTRSELEHLFLQLCRRHHLPLPEVNVRVGRLEVDFLWHRQRLIVETDGYRYHRGSQAFEEDHARDLALRVQGYDVLHLTYRQVTGQPKRAAAVVADALRGR